MAKEREWSHASVAGHRVPHDTFESVSQRVIVFPFVFDFPHFHSGESLYRSNKQSKQMQRRRYIGHAWLDRRSLAPPPADRTTPSISRTQSESGAKTVEYVQFGLGRWLGKMWGCVLVIFMASAATLQPKSQNTHFKLFNGIMPKSIQNKSGLNRLHRTPVALGN